MCWSHSTFRIEPVRDERVVKFKLLCANMCSWLYPLQRNMATVRETVVSQADREMEAEERINFLSMFERAWMIIQWDCSPLGWCSVASVI